MRGHDATDLRAVGHHAHEIRPHGLPRLAHERRSRRERMHAVEEQDFRAIDIPDAADDRLIHKEHTDGTSALDDFAIREIDVGFGVEGVGPDATAERSATIVVEDIDGDRAAQFEPNAIGPHPQANDAANLRRGHLA